MRRRQLEQCETPLSSASCLRADYFFLYFAFNLPCIFLKNHLN